MGTRVSFIVRGVLLSALSASGYAVNDAPPDVDTITLRATCTENNGTVDIANCFTSMEQVDSWLLNVRHPSDIRPTVINVGPGAFGGWDCKSSHVTLRGSGRSQTRFVVSGSSSGAAMWIQPGCTNLNVQDMSFDGSQGAWGVGVNNLEAITSWTNVEISGPWYGWVESIPQSCDNHSGKHVWFSSRIVSTGTSTTGKFSSRAYTASCAESWFFGSELVSMVNDNEASAFALEAHGAEIHLYGSNARLLLSSDTVAASFGSAGGGHYLIGATRGSAVHIHGTGLDVVHAGNGTADMLYADSTSHFHANESGFNIHVTGEGVVRRIAGTGTIEAPYVWKQGTQPPLSTTANGVNTLISVSGADTYIETDCPVTGNCSLGGSVPHQMVYRAECTGTGINQGPWFDLATRSCRQ